MITDGLWGCHYLYGTFKTTIWDQCFKKQLLTLYIHSSNHNHLSEHKHKSLVYYGKVSNSLSAQVSCIKPICPYKCSCFCFSLPATRWQYGHLCTLLTYMKTGQMNAIMSYPLMWVLHSTLLSASAKSLKPIFRSTEPVSFKLNNQ